MPNHNVSACIILEGEVWFSLLLFYICVHFFFFNDISNHPICHLLVLSLYFEYLSILLYRSCLPFVASIVLLEMQMLFFSVTQSLISSDFSDFTKFTFHLHMHETRITLPKPMELFQFNSNITAEFGLISPFDTHVQNSLVLLLCTSLSFAAFTELHREILILVGNPNLHRIP